MVIFRLYSHKTQGQDCIALDCRKNIRCRIPENHSFLGYLYVGMKNQFLAFMALKIRLEKCREIMLELSEAKRNS